MNIFYKYGEKLQHTLATNLKMHNFSLKKQKIDTYGGLESLIIVLGCSVNKVF